jgi:hypothetical protein
MLGEPGNRVTRHLRLPVRDDGLAAIEQDLGLVGGQLELGAVAI